MRSSLAVGLDAETQERVLPVLRYNDLSVQCISQAHEAAALARSARFEMVACAYPLPDMVLRDFAKAIRRPDSASRDSAMLILTLAEMCCEARMSLPAGRALVASRRAPRSRLSETVTHLVQLAPRRNSKTPVELRFGLNGSSMELAAELINISNSGMLVCNDEFPEVATECFFELQLDHMADPVIGRGQVVRHTMAMQERRSGFAVRFTEIEDTCRPALDGFLATSS